VLPAVVAPATRALASLHRLFVQNLGGYVPIAVAEVAAHLHQPANVAKVLLSDLIDVGAVITRPPAADAYTDNPEILEALLAGLRNL